MMNSERLYEAWREAYKVAAFTGKLKPWRSLQPREKLVWELLSVEIEQRWGAFLEGEK